MELHISIIIVTYNSKDYLCNCLSSILSSSTKSTYEIIVVDNASLDNTFQIVSPLYPSVKFIHNCDNNGFAYANNQGISIAKGEYLLLLNPDTLIIDNALDVMVEFMESMPDAGACGCKVLNDDGSLQPSTFGFPTLTKDLGHLFRLDRMTWLYSILKSSKIVNQLIGTKLSAVSNSDSITDVDYLLGACLMLRKSVIEKVGPLDDKIFMYIEDTEICHRLSINGYGVYYVPGGTIIHLGGKSSATNDQRMLYEYTRSRLYFYRKCYGNTKTNLLKTILVFDFIFKMLVIWFVKYKNEMQQLQTRYSGTNDIFKPVSYIESLSMRLQSFKLYKNILKMVISY